MVEDDPRIAGLVAGQVRHPFAVQRQVHGRPGRRNRKQAKRGLCPQLLLPGDIAMQRGADVLDQDGNQMRFIAIRKGRKDQRLFLDRRAEDLVFKPGAQHLDWTRQL